MIEIKRTDLLKKLEIVDSARASSVAIPQLTHFLFKKGQLIATDGSVSLGTGIYGLTLDCAVPGHLLSMVKTFQPPKGDKPDVILLEIRDNELRIGLPKSSKTQVRFSVMDVPPVDVPRKPSASAIPCPKEIIDAIQHCMRSVGKEEGHLAELGGVTAIVKESELSVYATNAKTISKERVKVSGLEPGRYIMPTNFCKYAVSLYDDPEHSKIEFTPTRVLLHTRKATVVGDYIMTDNPFDFEKTIDHHFPKDQQSKAQTIPKDFGPALDRAVILTQNTVDQNRTKIAISKDMLSLESFSDRGEAKDRIKLPGHDEVRAVVDATLVRPALDDFQDMLLTDRCLVLKKPGALYLVSTKAE